MAKLLGPRSGIAWAGWTGKNKHSAFSSWLQLVLATTGSLSFSLSEPVGSLAII